MISAEGTVKTELKSCSFPLGVAPEEEFPLSGPIRLQTGDVVALLTDGILEARSPDYELFGTERAIATLAATRHKSARAIIESLFAAVRDFSQREHPQDDMTAVVLKVERLV